MAIKTYKDILAWQKDHELVLIIYKAIRYSLDMKKYNLISRTITAVLLAACNIVEGFIRATLAESLRFYNIAQTSLEELKYQTFVCFRTSIF